MEKIVFGNNITKESGVLLNGNIKQEPVDAEFYFESEEHIISVKKEEDVNFANCGFEEPFRQTISNEENRNSIFNSSICVENKNEETAIDIEKVTIKTEPSFCDNIEKEKETEILPETETNRILFKTEVQDSVNSELTEFQAPPSGNNSIGECLPGSSSGSNFVQETADHLPEYSSGFSFISLGNLPTEEIVFPNSNTQLNTNAEKNCENATKNIAKKRYECPICNKTLSRSNNLKIHMLGHNPERPFKCTLCTKSYVTKFMLRQHHSQVHDTDNTFPCPICAKIFSTKGAMNLHMKTHSGERKQECTICKKVFSCKAGVKLHMMKHSEDKQFKCHLCSKQFFRSYELANHIEAHEKKNKHKCQYCEKVYSIKSVLNAHVRKFHTREGLFKCKFCKKEFLSKQHCEEHQWSHTGEKPYECDICSKKFTAKGTLKLHIISHMNEYSHQCKKCGKGFLSKGRLDNHYKVHTGQKEFSCAICEKTFLSKRYVKEHLRIHSDERKQTCPICNKVLSTKLTLKKHVLTHSSKITRTCDICLKEFNKEGYYNRHMKSHRKKQQKCSKCGKFCGNKKQNGHKCTQEEILGV